MTINKNEIKVSENLLLELQCTDLLPVQYTNIVKLYNSKLPEETPTYIPVSYQHLHELVYELLCNYGYTVTSVQSKLPPKFKGEIIPTFITTFSIKGKGDPSQGEFTKMVAIQSSHDKSSSIKIVGGSFVNICTNGNIFGEIIEVRKHTKNVYTDIYDKFQLCIKGIEKNYSEFIIMSDNMKNVPLRIEVTKSLIGIIYYACKEVGVDINATIMNNIYRDIKKLQPTNVWELYNIYTDRFKELPIDMYINGYKTLLEEVNKYLMLIKTRMKK